MASLTKLFTTIAALQQLDAGTLDLHATVASYIPKFAVHGKENITILMLLTHTSGFAPDPVPPLYSKVYKTYKQRINAIITQKIEDPPGSTYTYSDLNFMTMFLVLEKITGKKLDQLVATYTDPLGMKSTFFNRGNLYPPQFPQATYDRMATQEFQIAVLGPKEPKRPQVSFTNQVPFQVILRIPLHHIAPADSGIPLHSPSVAPYMTRTLGHFTASQAMRACFRL